MARNIYNFPDKNSAPISEVGGKGFSLITASQADLPVSPGFILPVNFFTPWIDRIRNTASWSEFTQANSEDLEKICTMLKDEVRQMSFTEQQYQEINAATKKYGADSLFAVRSSSPEEDLEGASFAGGYQTVLGVALPDLEDAVKKAFSSCFDYRVIAYKLASGFDIKDPKIAVIVQEQIASDMAGVGFSMNPVTNDFDEAVFNANWGLGETVVSGIASPDSYFVDKVSMTIKNKVLGKKEISISLAANGGTEEKKGFHSDLFTLSSGQIRELTKLIIKVEALYGKPIDIEWAYFQKKLYLLQARPITAYVSLPPEMLTNPGERKRLYIDATISVQGIYQPLSIASTSFFALLLKEKIGRKFFWRDITKDINYALPWASPGRLYVNLSNVLRLTDKKAVADFLLIMDPLAAEAIRNIDEREYVSSISRLKLLPFGFVAKLPRIASHIFLAKVSPERVHLKTQRKLALFMQKAQVLSEKELPVTIFADKLFSCLVDDVFLNTVPLFILGKNASGKMKKLAGNDLHQAFEPLEVALKNNVTTQMGLDLYGVSEFLPKDLSLEEVAIGISEKTLPKPFMAAWKKFLKSYGFRGPSEIDVAAPRYRENQQLLVSMLFSMKTGKEDGENNPIGKFRTHQKASRRAYEYIYGEIKKRSGAEAERFKKQYEIFETFAGYRETHKLYLAAATDFLRKRILKEAKLLFAAGRLETVEQIFDLTLEEIDMCIKDKTIDLTDLAKENRKFTDQIARVPHLPSVIDSRGLILRPKVKIFTGGTVIGTPIAPGIVRGRIKILHSPSEKPFLKGEILVARATDPGWTPLFVNAGAIILEIGGMLQHGALVAREYGLPCVSGVENATEIWKDGDLVEVDGAVGTITVLS